MANKEKLLASAQKSLQKGQVARAIKDYEKVVDLDPRDIRNRQKLAELYSRAKMTEQAMEAYETVARYYSENGFYLKAIAVYKQVQKLDPASVNTYHRLAELNEKQGLIGNAMAEYRSLVAYYEKQQMSPEAISVLQKMKDLEPENLNIRVKIAETYAKSGLQDKGLAEFQEILTVLKKKGDHGKVLRLCQIFAPLFEGQAVIKIAQAQALVESGEVTEGIPLLQSLLKEHPEDQDILGVLARGYRKSGDFANECRTFKMLLEKLPGDLDLRNGYIRACIDAEDYAKAVEELEAVKESFFEADRVHELQGHYEQLRGQLPADNRIAKTLYSIYQVTGEGDKLFDILSEAPDVTSGTGSGSGAEAEETLDDSILDGAVEDLEDFEGFEEFPEPAEVPDDLPDLLGHAEEEAEEIPLEFLEDVDEVEACSEEPGLATEDVETELEIEPETDEESELAASSGAVEEDLELELELDLDEDFSGDDEPAVDDAPIPLEVSEETAAQAPDETLALDTSVGGDDSSVADLLDLDLDEALGGEETEGPVDLAADLEEAEFYLQQGLYDEAEDVCRAILKASPGTREAELKLAEIESRRGVAGEAAVEPPPAEAATEVAPPADNAGAVTTGAAEQAQAAGGASSESPRLGEQIAADDAESHFNLGIAYKEMGLIDDAIGEFDQARKHPGRLVDSLTLKGLCLVERGSAEEAEGALREALDYPDLTDDQRISLHYEIGLLYEGQQRLLEALDSFQYVAEIDTFFRDVGQKIQQLRASLGLGDDADGGNGGDSGPKGNKDRVSYV